MKKEDQDITLLESDVSSDKDHSKDSFKTTNINILLNRVRHNKKKKLNKKIYFFCIIIGIYWNNCWYNFNLLLI